MGKEAINSKVIIIDKNGEPHYMGDVSSIDLHNDYLLKYIDDYYHGDEEFSLVDENTYNKITTYHLLNVGEVVYLNNGYFGAIFVPENMTQAQIKAIYDLALYLGNQPILFNYNPSTDLGFLSYQAKGIDEDKNLKEVMDEYLDEFEIDNPPFTK